jgi:hypothetical protein
LGSALNVCGLEITVDLFFVAAVFALGTTPTVMDWNTQVRNKPNIVTTDTVQTITASKTFSAANNLQGNCNIQRCRYIHQHN